MYGGISGISQGDIYRKYLEMGRTAPGLKKDEGTFYR